MPRGQREHELDHDGAPARRVVIISTDARRRRELSRALADDNVVCALCQSTDECIELLRPEPTGPALPRYEAVVYDLPRCNEQALDFVRELGDQHVPTVIVCPTVSFDEAVEAMRAGAADIVSASIKPRELQRRLRSALNQSEPGPSIRPARAGKQRARKLSAGKLPPSAPCPEEHAMEHEPIPADPVHEFAQRIRSELDVETLLRQVLEFVLAQIGPTNAAVFLPGQSGDYSLGAYVNYSCPKETAEVLLDHLANVAAPRLERLTTLIQLNTKEKLEEHIGECADWLGEQHVTAFACRSEGECLALFMLFREPSSPFGPASVALLSELSRVFGAQLARVVKIHHRHLPRDKWGTLGDPIDDNEADDRGMAA
jgi:DNA-binding response OmpR family regulator